MTKTIVNKCKKCGDLWDDTKAGTVCIPCIIDQLR